MTKPASPAYWLYRSFWTGLDWLYPPICGGCGQPGTRWCFTCQENTQILSPPFCQFCGEKLTSGELCSRCSKLKPSYQALRAWGIFAGPLRSALHQLKYRKDVALGEVLARPMIDLYCKTGWKVDIVLPVPLSVARLAQRGYNQASLLARPLAFALGLEYCPRGLQKVRETVSQVGLNIEQRRENIAGAFNANSHIVLGKTILVVDDVTTSGATLEACTQALISGGAKRVYGMTLARAG